MELKYFYFDKWHSFSTDDESVLEVHNQPTSKHELTINNGVTN